MMSVLVETPECKRTLICKGAPEAIVKKCSSPDPSVRARLDAQFDTGSRCRSGHPGRDEDDGDPSERRGGLELKSSPTPTRRKAWNSWAP